MTAKALAAQPAFFHAYHSLRNTGKALLNFAYGTPARANMTMVFALSLALAGSFLMSPETQAMLSVCTN